MPEVVRDVERLAQRDVEAVLSNLREIYASSDIEGFAYRVVSTLPRLIRLDTVSYNEIDPRSLKAGTLVLNPPAPDHDSVAEILGQHMHEHPLFNHYRQTGDGRAFTISDFLTKSQWRKRALYNEYYKEIWGMEHQMGCGIPAPAISFGLALNRSGQDFSERDRSVLDLLRPHLAQAHQNATALTQTRREAGHFRRAFEGSERGMIMLSSGQVQWCNEQARRWLEGYFEPARGADRLPESLTRWAEHQKSLLAGAEGVPPLLKPLLLKRLGKHLLVRLVEDDSEEGADLLMLEEWRAPLSVDSLRASGFTAREAEVLVHIARGKTNNEIAEILYLSPQTVKKHLENVYRKLGVTSRTEALSHALQALNLLE